MRMDRKTPAGVLLIFATYFYFLIFAQFAFLELVQSGENSEGELRVVMAFMAFGGVAGSFAIPAFRSIVPPSTWLRLGLLGCGISAFLPFFSAPPNIMALIAGLSLGILTVSLASSLPSLFEHSNWGLAAGAGTGAAYCACNVPAVFQAPPEIQAVAAGLVCVISATAVPHLERPRMEPCEPKNTRSFLFFLLLFALLVWLDSAAFYVVQHTPMKEGTWGSSSNLWRNSAVHLGAALLTGMVLPRAGPGKILGLAFLLLIPASLSANNLETRWLTGWLYPPAVSIYSTCLVAFPGWGMGSIPQSRVIWMAAVLYAIAGWIGSGLGIGMAQDLHYVPWEFVASVAALASLPYLWTWAGRLRGEIGYAGLVIIAGVTARFLLSPAAEQEGQLDPVEQGRKVYLAEGCINCHSQYVKPGSPDEVLWGPVQPIETLLSQRPPVFGNRRQGPDLTNVGNRRSPSWIREHFLSPRSLVPGSSMPSYAHLFEDDRGQNLVAYLSSLGRNTMPERIALMNRWMLSPAAQPASNPAGLFRNYCASCHGPEGHGDGPLRERLSRPPPSLPPKWLGSCAAQKREAQQQLARIIKFGTPGTDMPGHEYLRDEEIFALALFVEHLMMD